MVADKSFFLLKTERSISYYRCCGAIGLMMSIYVEKNHR